MTSIRDDFIDVLDRSVSDPDYATKLDTPLYQLGSDSLDVVELIMGVEERFNIEVPDADVFASDKFDTSGMEPLKLNTPNDWLVYIEGKLADGGVSQA